MTPTRAFAARAGGALSASPFRSSSGPRPQRARLLVPGAASIHSPLSQHGPAGSGAAAPAQQLNDRVAAPAPQPHDDALAPPRELRVMSLISDCVALQAAAARLESLAGRSAMIGVLVALLAELLTERSVVRHLSSDAALSVAGALTVTVAVAVAAATASKRRAGLELLEAVVTSLTANQRSAASVTGRQVDGVVDAVLARAFRSDVLAMLDVDSSDDEPAAP